MVLACKHSHNEKEFSQPSTMCPTLEFCATVSQSPPWNPSQFSVLPDLHFLCRRACLLPPSAFLSSPRRSRKHQHFLRSRDFQWLLNEPIEREKSMPERRAGLSLCSRRKTASNFLLPTVIKYKLYFPKHFSLSHFHDDAINVDTDIRALISSVNCDAEHNE